LKKDTNHSWKAICLQLFLAFLGPCKGCLAPLGRLKRRAKRAKIAPLRASGIAQKTSIRGVF
jgi:hypothetical protein